MAANRPSPNSAQTLPRYDPGRPGPDQIARWLDLIRTTGEPEKLPGLSWTEPPKGASFFWLSDEINVPIEKRVDRQLIACPFCSHGKPKFRRGRFCWFPAEGVTRFLGNVCARRHLDQDLLKEADREWKEAKRRAARDAFLRSNCAAVADLLKAVAAIRSAASGADHAHASLVTAARGVLKEIRRHANSGPLMADETPPAGAQWAHQQSFRVALGTLSGRSALKSKLTLIPKLDRTARQLEDIAGDCRRAGAGELTHMSQRRRDEVQILLRVAHSELVDIVNLISDFREFFSDRNVALLNRWAAHPGSNIAWMNVAFARQGLLFVIRLPNVRADQRPRVILTSAVFDPLPKITSLS